MRNLADYAGLLAVLAALTAFFALSTEHFFSPVTFRTIANQIPEAIFLSIGMTFVLIIAGIDLSVGSVMGLCGAVVGLCLTRGEMPVALAISAALVVGTLCGLLNGMIVVRWTLPAFIVTLGMLEAGRGATYLVSQSKTAYIGARIERIAEIAVAGLSLPFLVALALVVIAHVVLTRTVFGRYMTAIGTNEEAVRLSGIGASPVKVAVYAISGALAALASVSNVARLGAADPNAGIGMELNAIAAVVIGGTSLMGGRGSVINSFFGVLIIAVLENGLAQMGAQEPTKRLVTGFVIVAAVILDYYRNRVWKVKTFLLSLAFLSIATARANPPVNVQGGVVLPSDLESSVLTRRIVHFSISNSLMSNITGVIERTDLVEPYRWAFHSAIDGDQAFERSADADREFFRLHSNGSEPIRLGVSGPRTEVSTNLSLWFPVLTGWTTSVQTQAVAGGQNGRMLMVFGWITLR